MSDNIQDQINTFIRRFKKFMNYKTVDIKITDTVYLKIEIDIILGRVYDVFLNDWEFISQDHNTNNFIQWLNNESMISYQDMIIFEPVNDFINDKREELEYFIEDCIRFCDKNNFDIYMLLDHIQDINDGVVDKFDINEIKKDE